MMLSSANLQLKVFYTFRHSSFYIENSATYPKTSRSLLFLVSKICHNKAENSARGLRKNDYSIDYATKFSAHHQCD